MKNKEFPQIFLISFIAMIFVSSFTVSSTGSVLVYATTSLGQSIQQEQQDLQATINKEVQQTFTETIDSINTVNNSNINNSNIDNNTQSDSTISLSPSSFQDKVSEIDNLPTQKVKVDDIDVAYKQIGDGNSTIVLITGLGGTMDMWSPNLLNNLTNAPNDYKVIIFDNRGSGESTIGTKEFSINQFANDTLGLLDALGIDKPDVLGWSMGAFIAQQVASVNPDRVNSLILYASSCGGPDAVPPTPEVIQAYSNTSLTPEEVGQKSIELMFPTSWFEVNPNYMNYIPIPTESVSPEVTEMQTRALENWSGNCQILGNITSPTLVIVGTDDYFTPAANSINIVERVPGAWLIQIKDSGHGLMYQYPEMFNEAVLSFLSIQEVQRGNSNNSAMR
jgi:pimeloyl-ACP methyl ester carboxylesterase